MIENFDNKALGSAPSLQTLVIGGGVVGVCCALALQKAGRQVLLVEKDTVGGGASGGNAGHIASEQIYPVASPDILTKIPGMLFDPLGALRIDFRYLPNLTPWFMKLLCNLRSEPFAHSSRALQQLNRLSLPSWEHLLASEHLSSLIRVNGSYLVAEKQNSRKSLQEKIKILEKVGVAAHWYDQKRLNGKLPLLNQQQLGGIFFPETAHVVCPKALCLSLQDKFHAHGGETIKATVQSISANEDNVQVRLADHEDLIVAKDAVIATGVFSSELVKLISGINPPLQAERGYHLMTEMTLNATAEDIEEFLPAPVTSVDRNFIMTPMQHGIRLAGTVEYASPTAKPNYQCAKGLLKLANGMLNQPLQRTQDDAWMGCRPTLPDSLPVIDRVGRIAYAFGHQHLGLTQAPVTAQWIVQLLTDSEITADISPYRLNRFK